ncbi:MAG: hypothetical protein KatS3mg114_0762 [Planctomycetaceae bacterium]|nr:MAG: hypothetical protein KatS3mg114_0762 [Planctomycetaceae bacterium]
MLAQPDLRLQQELRAVARRGARAAALSWLALGWSALAMLATVWHPRWEWGSPVCLYGLGILALVWTIPAWWLARWRWSLKHTAHMIESRWPELNARLLTAMQLTPDSPGGQFHWLQRRVLHEVLVHSAHQPWRQVISSRWILGSNLGLSLAVVWWVVLWRLVPMEATLSASRGANLGTQTFLDWPVIVEPGDVEVERGSPLLLLARFPTQLPQRVQVVTENASNSTRYEAQQSLDDPLFGVQLPSVTHNFSYHFTYDGHRSPDYQVTVYDLPAVEQFTVTIVPPTYAERPQQVLEQAFTVSVLQGSQLTLEVRGNKPLVRMELVLDEEQSGSTIAMPLDAHDPRIGRVTWTPEATQSWRLRLVDERQRTNRDPETFRVTVLPNRLPKLRWTFPGRDSRVSPLEEVVLEGEVSDDIGVERYGLLIERPGHPPQRVELGTKVPGGTLQSFAYTVHLESWDLQPNDVLAVAWFACDRDEQGKLRETMSELLWLEIRPYEEIYRELDLPGGNAGNLAGGNQPEQQGLQRLLERQKQIVTALFNQIRHAEPWSEELAERIEVIRQSQQMVRERVLSQMPELETPMAQRLGGQAADAMQQVLQRLDESRAGSSQQPLSLAYTAAQEAYQALLRLRTRETRVAQGQQGGGGAGGGASPAEQQLRELELSDRQQRYQTRSQATSAIPPQQEELAMLARLKELAQRQADLAEKLRELEAARHFARDPQQQQELERQLKRLREEQQQLLQDADALRDRWAQSPRQEQFSPWRQQLEQTRRHLLESSEQLREGRLSQALSSAQRAERDLQRLQQEFRQQTSARFAQQLRELREAARQLQLQEALLREQLQHVQESSRAHLRGSRERQQLEAEFHQQAQQVQDWLQQARQLVQESETAEPLLSQQLYENLRQLRGTRFEQALESLPPLIRQGMFPQAQQAEQQVQRGLDQLQQGIDQAARAVLGDEVEGMRRAKAELAELSQQLREEFERQQAARAGPDDTSARQGDPNSSRAGHSSSTSAEPTNSNDRPDSSSRTSAQSGAQGQADDRADQTGPPASATSSSADTASGGSDSTGSATEGQTAQRGETTRAPRPGLRGGRSSAQSPASAQGGFDRSGGGGNAGPLTGDGYREWSERLRDVETMLSDPELQAEVARLREQARSLRADFQRHSVTPNWELVRTTLYQPLQQLQHVLSEEVARREDPERLVPIDRDPVPSRYRELVRQYYERLARDTPASSSTLPEQP